MQEHSAPDPKEDTMPRRPRNQDEFEQEWENIKATIGVTDMEIDALAVLLFDHFRSFLRAGFARDDVLRILAYGIYQQPDKEYPDE
jgi:hypothetical protein